jgi:Uma2 family endonuclease
MASTAPASTIPAPPPDDQDDGGARLRWLREALWPQRVERYGGGLLVSGAPDPEHQEAVGYLLAWLLDECVRSGEAEVLPGTELRLEGRGLPRPRRGRRPDNGVPDLLLRRFDNPRCRRVPSGPRGRPAGWVEGAPDLVVEIRSPSTEDFDLTVKRRAFAAALVPHYWVLDWSDHTALVLTAPGDPREQDGDYRVEATVPWAELRWPPGGERRWGDDFRFRAEWRP